jgi:hypothetical protein
MTVIFLNQIFLEKSFRYTSGTTASGGVLQYVRRNLIFNSAAGARSDAKKVVFVVTHGRQIIPQIQAKELRRVGVKIFALGITNSFKNTGKLPAIATSSFHVFRVKNFVVLNQVTQAIQRGKFVHDILKKRPVCLPFSFPEPFAYFSGNM